MSRTDQRLGRVWPFDGQFNPVFSGLLRNRWSMLILVGAALLQVLLVSLDLEGWQCPIKTSLHVPCPGCGLSGAIVLLIHGEWRAAILTHAFAPVFLIGILASATISFLPGHVHRKTLNWMTLIEQKTGFSTFILVMLIAYWALRLYAARANAFWNI